LLVYPAAATHEADCATDDFVRGGTVVNMLFTMVQAIRDIMLKRDIARWLQAKMLEIEEGLVGRGAEEKVTFLNIFTMNNSQQINKIRTPAKIKVSALLLPWSSISSYYNLTF
jgi:hypothetical protein